VICSEKPSHAHARRAAGETEEVQLMPRIFIDGDACSTQKIKQKFSGKHDAEVVTVVSIENCANIHARPNTIVVDSTPQAADIEIFNRMRQGDIVITKDYGLASLVLGKHGKAMSPSGFMYTRRNIELLLHQRYVNGILRNAGGRRRKRRPKYQDMDK
jgi:uncharacterized protein